MRQFERLFERKAVFAVVMGSLLVSSLAQRYLGHVMGLPNVDFYDYYFAAQVVHENPRANIYDGATDANPQLRSAPLSSDLLAHARSAGFDDIELYLYPPLLADLLAPVSGIPPYEAAALWRTFNLVLVLAVSILLAHMIRVSILSFEFATLLLFAFSFWPIHETLSDGQVSIVMLMLLTTGIVAYSGGRVILSASVIAIATALKITPVLLLPVFFIWKDRKWLISYLTVSFGLVLTMIAINGSQTVSTYGTVMTAMSGGAPAMTNKSISSLVAWIYYGKVFTLSSVHGVMTRLPPTLAITTKIVSGAFYLLCLVMVWRSRRKLDFASKATTIALFSLIIACVSPVSWRHSYTVALIALAIYWAKALQATCRRYQLVLLSLTTFALGSNFFDLAAQAPLPEFVKVSLSGSWIIFSVLFSLDALFQQDSILKTGSKFDHACKNDTAWKRTQPPGVMVQPFLATNRCLRETQLGCSELHLAG